MAATDRPGIYFNTIARGNNALGIPGAGLPSDTGKFFSPNELIIMLDFLSIYIDSGAIPNKKARDFDSKFQTGSKQWQHPTNNLDERRYAPTVDSKQILHEWAGILKRQYLSGVRPSDLDTKFDRCLFEVGYSNNVSKRLMSHYNNTNTTYLFAFLHSWTKHSMPLLSRFGPCHQYTIFRLWKKDSHLASVAEFCATLLTSSLHTMGGLNCTLPGKVSTESDSVPQNSPHWESNLISSFRCRHTSRVVASEKGLLSHRHNLLTEIPKLSALEDEVKQLDQTLKQKRESLEKLQVSRDDLRSQVDPLKSDLLVQVLDQERFNPNTNPSSIPAMTRDLIGIVNDLRLERFGHDTAIADWLAGRPVTEPHQDNAVASNAYRKVVSNLRRNHGDALAAWSINFETRKRSSDREKRAGDVTLTKFMAEMEAAGESAVQHRRGEISALVATSEAGSNP
ncbi:hypothetical protein MMC18_005965 [Xylographa bjoerkii]|nr:hypothetical protein [Xylographa bjoerkii]